MNREEKNFVLGVFGLALVLRLAYVFFLYNYYPFYDNPGSDVYYYQTWAEEIARGRWQEAFRYQGLPLYPYFLALLKVLTFHSAGLLRLVLLGLGSVTGVLVYFLGRALFSRRIAGLAAVLTAVNPLLIYYDWLMMPVSLLAVLALLLVSAFVSPERLTRRHEWGIVGLLAGVLCLGDAKTLFFVPAMLAVVLFSWPRSRRQKCLAVILPFLLGLGMVLAGFAFQHKAVTGSWVFISSEGGLAFYAGNNPRAAGYYTHPLLLRASHEGQDQDQKMVAEAALGRTLGPREVSRFWVRAAVKFIREQPGDYLRLLGRKARLFFTDTAKAHDIDLLLQQKWLTGVDINPFFLMVPLALFGAAVMGSRRGRAVPLGLLVLSQFVFTLVFHLTTRHRAAVIPALILFEAYALDWTAQRLSRKGLLQNAHPRRSLLFRLCGVRLGRLRAQSSKPCTWTFCTSPRKGPIPVLGVFVAGVVYMLLCPPQPENPRYVRYFSDVKHGQRNELNGHYQDAQRYYRRALGFAPGDPDTLFSLGNAYLLDGDYRQAQPWYRRAIQINPFHVDAVYNLGCALEQTGDREEAKQCYRGMLRYQPDSLDARLRLGQVLAGEKNCAEAAAHLLFVARQRPDMAAEIDGMIQRCQTPFL